MAGATLLGLQLNDRISADMKAMGASCVNSF